MFLSLAEADAIDARIARIEARTGAQIITAVIARCDAYPEVVWKAFALGASLAALAVVVLDLVRPDWVSVYSTLSNVLPIIVTGAASAICAVAIPAYARLFLNPFHVEAEVRQHAQALFLTRQLFRTHARNGVLVLVSVFERRVEVIADIGFDGQVDRHQWQLVIDAMTPVLATARPAEALLRGLDRLEELLVSRNIARDEHGANELPNRAIEEGGA